MRTNIILHFVKKYSGPTFMFLVYPFFAKAQLYTARGTSLIANGSVNIVLNNIGLNNNGSFAPSNGTVIFTGDNTTPSSIIKGSTITGFNDLTINRSANDVLLNNSISVDGNLSFISGNLQLNNFNVDLGSGAGAIIGETNSSRIIGVNGGLVLKTASLNAPAGVNPGNIGISITSSANLGLTVVKRGHVMQTLSGSSSGIDRYFDIASANNASLNATIKFNYLEAELDGQTESTLVFWSSTDGGNSWTQIGEDGRNTNKNTVTKNNLASLFRFTLSSGTLIPFSSLSQQKTVIDKNKACFSLNAIYPNPTNGMVHIDLYSNTNMNCDINLFTQSGQLLETKKLAANKGINSINWSVSKYAAGVYYFVFNGPVIKTARIIKLD